MPFFSGKCHSKARLYGKTAIITGCNTGIGKETLRDFYKRGAHVIMACRDTKKAEATKDDVMKKCKGLKGLGRITIVKLDLASLKSVRECAENILHCESHIDILVNNAGLVCPQAKTEDGFEMQFGTNHLGHFLFTILLLPRIIHSKPARIVNVSSEAYEYSTMDFDDLHFEKRTYSALKAYCQSKLANVLFTRELAKRLKDKNIEGVNVYSLHPGAVKTDVDRHFDEMVFRGFKVFFSFIKFLFYKNAESGAQTTIYCAVDEKCANETGLHYSDCAVRGHKRNALNEDDAKRLWELSCHMVGLQESQIF